MSIKKNLMNDDKQMMAYTVCCKCQMHAVVYAQKY